MGDDITMTTALFQMVQRIEDKIDNVKDDLSSVKSKQSIIETSLADHIASSEAKPSGVNAVQAFMLKYMIPIALCLLLLGRMSVNAVGNGYTRTPKEIPSKDTKIDDTFITRNERADSLIRCAIKKSAGL